ncbi:uncharacterized protein PITG_12890 [Phytophthora infestans T30-4]|uniref:Uncharacterized protein n=1 Tax=Phytophthora infestans (strain T30-4) TaxID=403677 RepID=D0NLE5_PHYIT|nr:uncharacterized protein PITG_12890 [Phytophthora infestans T30-4]EEY60463.1 conserved hypothetical protein [Phytophthora infestans T30-4]|eukprot:XP_002900259.1 conserved hypothetical protein [Phytophthora infestans T30-4]
MELFTALNVRRVEDQRAIERIMATRDKRWLASLGLRASRSSQLSSCTEGNGEAERQADPDAEMAALDDEMVDMALNTPAENERPVQLSMRLIRESLALSRKSTRRTRSPEHEDKEVEAMLGKKVLRLDWLDIGKIENLDAFTHVEELYLQYNLVETIEGLEDHQRLAFLALAGNRIREVKNLKHLQNVEVELPQSEQDVLETQGTFEAEKKAFNLADYEKQRSDRMSKWKTQLTALTSRTRDQLAESGESIKAGTSTRFQERRSLALSRARRATDAALVDAASHFKQVRSRVRRRKKVVKRSATS